jgi:hypothetical protein
MTKIINLDAVADEPSVIIEVDGKRHPMVKPTVASFLANMKLVEELGLNPSPVKEMEGGIAIIRRAFPSITEKEMQAWPLERIQRLVDISRSMAGEVATQNEAEATSGNAPKAS